MDCRVLPRIAADCRGLPRINVRKLSLGTNFLCEKMSLGTFFLHISIGISVNQADKHRRQKFTCKTSTKHLRTFGLLWAVCASARQIAWKACPWGQIFTPCYVKNCPWGQLFTPCSVKNCPWGQIFTPCSVENCPWGQFFTMIFIFIHISIGISVNQREKHR